ncbi:MAG: methyltransferase domain-containing protein [Miltoncostaeaceae bacterium]
MIRTVVVADTPFLVAHPPSAEALIDEEAYAIDERLPYWADLWPSAHVLAAHLAGRDLAGVRVLELGCGIGLPAVCAAHGGARVLATDWYQEALTFTRRNAEANGVEVETLLVDWRRPPAALADAGPFDLIVGADVLYEQRNGVALAPLVASLAEPGCEVVIADPRRPHSGELTDRLVARGWDHATEEVRHGARVDESGPVIRLHHLSPPR